MQLTSVARYGAGENCSTDPFFLIAIKVGLYYIFFQYNYSIKQGKCTQNIQEPYSSLT